MEDDVQNYLQLSCFVGHPVNIYICMYAVWQHALENPTQGN